jgi:hypothetical protein
MKKLAVILLVGTMTGCVHHAYKPQRIDVRAHTIVLHATKVEMENAYEQVWAKRRGSKSKKKKRGEYGGFFNGSTNELHCYGPWPEVCMLHEYKHLGVKYGLEVPDDPHFKKRVIRSPGLKGFNLTGH